MRCALTLVVFLAILGPAQAQEPGKVVIGSKAFTEGQLLGEVMAQLLEATTDLTVERRMGLGGTKICFDALRAGEIDAYAEYTGTGLVSILGEEARGSELQSYAHVRREFLTRYRLEWLGPFGFNNTYALAMPEAKAKALGVRTITDLAGHPEVRVGLSLEFLQRKDGWPSLRDAYGLKPSDVRGMEHGLAYAAVQSGEIDVIDAYSTDGKLLRYALRVLEDDRRHFPQYHAAPLVRSETLERHPQVRAQLERLALCLNETRMQALNDQVESEKRSFAEVAREFLRAEGLIEGGPARAPSEPSARKQGFVALFIARAGETAALAWEHLLLTLIAVLLATLVSVPLGIACTRRPRLAQPVLGGAGVIQTIPSLALLAFMIPIPGLGLGATSAVVALFLYAILPIVRNTYTGIREVDPDLVEAARGMGLTDGQILRFVQLPLASRTIMAGVRTSTVISVGVATLAAFIGAGGLGEPIITGLTLNDANLILCGAIPAALLAVFVDLALGGLERVVVPKGVST